MSLTSTLLIVAITGCAMWVQTMVGFGYSLLAVPLMTFTIEPKMAVVIATSVALLGNASLARAEWEHCDRRTAARMILGAMIGSPIGIVVSEVASARVLRFGLAIALFAFVIVNVRGLRLRTVNRSVDLIFGGVSGVLNTSLSTNGPPLVAVLHARHLPPPVFRATLAVIFTVSGVFAMALFALSGRYDHDTLVAILWAMPAMLAGLGLGRALRKHVPMGAFRNLVLGLIIATAIASAVNAITG